MDRAGGCAALLCPTDEGPASDSLARFDGLLLVGGGDVDPARHGEEPHPETYGVDGTRDRAEIELALAADRMRLPTLGICRGPQLINVAFGGSLFQHLPDRPELERHCAAPGSGERVHHEVKVAESSRLFAACGRATMDCPSAHHQGLARLGEGLLPVAWAGDGLVEAVERVGGWMLGVQWHPEDSPEDPSQQGLFDELVARARARRGEP